MSTSEKFHGWAATGKGLPLEWTELPLKQFDQDTVEMDVSHCAVCGSDIHTIDSDWGKTNYPTVVGHEIVGTATRVGANVKHIKVGDRVGVGSQSGACLECPKCKNNDEHLCQGKRTPTYNGTYPNGDISFGGYGDRWRGHSRFVFKVPDTMSNEDAASFFCAGVSTYAPFKRYGVNAFSKVGVIGIGGLGHFGVQWAKAMGAEVVALSSSERKRDDAKELGCDDYVVTSDPEQMKPHLGTFTHILCTYIGDNFDWKKYFDLMDTDGYFILVALPGKLLSGIPAMSLACQQIALVGSHIGSPRMIEDMLQFAAKHHVKPWINKYSMNECNEAIQAFREGKPRYRIILEN